MDSRVKKINPFKRYRPKPRKIGIPNYKNEYRNLNSFHLAGIIPVAGQPLDYGFEWADCLMPVAKDYTAIEHAVMQCAWAGCETIWMVINDDISPLIKKRIGEWVIDPISVRWPSQPDLKKKRIPIYYVPMHQNDLGKRDSFVWSILYGTKTAYYTSRQISNWVVPDAYFVAFPYGMFNPELIRPHRKTISTYTNFFFSYKNKTVREDVMLPFTFTSSEFIYYRRLFRKRSINIRTSYGGNKIEPERRWNARFFKLHDIFEIAEPETSNVVELPWYYDISNWNGYHQYMSSEESKKICRPKNKLVLNTAGRRKFNPMGINENES